MVNNTQTEGLTASRARHFQRKRLREEARRGRSLAVTNCMQKRWPVLILMPVVAFLLSFSVGRYAISPAELISTIYYHFADPAAIADHNMETVIFNVRLPRVIAVLLVGAGLSVAGASYQGMFKNPLVSPDLLGAAAGAGFGAALGLLMMKSMMIVELYSFIGGVAAVFIAVNINRKITYDPLLGLVLGGIMVSTMFQAGISLIKFLADSDDLLPAITFWLMGGFTSIEKKDLFVLVPIIVAACIILFAMSFRLNVLSFGEEEARSLGVNARQTRVIVIVAATLITAASVSQCGMIGWIGLVVPHMCRSIVGPNFRQLLPVSAIIGSVFLLVVDTIVRCMSAVELPIGVLTSVIGVPVFFIIFNRNSH